MHTMHLPLVSSLTLGCERTCYKRETADHCPQNMEHSSPNAATICKLLLYLVVACHVIDFCFIYPHHTILSSFPHVVTLFLIHGSFYCILILRLVATSVTCSCQTHSCVSLYCSPHWTEEGYWRVAETFTP